MTRIELAQACINKYGAEAQRLKMVGEGAELMAAICRLAEGRFVEDQVAEEIADCLAILDQMDILFDVTKNNYGITALYTGYNSLFIIMGGIQIGLANMANGYELKKSFFLLFYLLRCELMGLSKEIGQDKVDTWRQIKADRMIERLKI